MSESRTTQLAPTATVLRKSDVLGSNIDGEIVLMSAGQSAYFGLDRIGSAVWRQLAIPVRVDTLCRDMAMRFDGDAALIEADTLAFLAALLDRDLIVVQAPAA